MQARNMSGSIGCAMQKLLIAMFIFQQLLSGVRSQAISPVPSCGDNPAPDSIIEGPPYTNQTESKRRTKVSTTVL
jgi:hypothetical protein